MYLSYRELTLVDTGYLNQELLAAVYVVKCHLVGNGLKKCSKA